MFSPRLARCVLQWFHCYPFATIELALLFDRYLLVTLTGHNKKVMSPLSPTEIMMKTFRAAICSMFKKERGR